MRRFAVFGRIEQSEQAINESETKDNWTIKFPPNVDYSFIGGCGTRRPEEESAFLFAPFLSLFNHAVNQRIEFHLGDPNAGADRAKKLVG